MLLLPRDSWITDRLTARNTMNIVKLDTLAVSSIPPRKQKATDAKVVRTMAIRGVPVLGCMRDSSFGRAARVDIP